VNDEFRELKARIRTLDTLLESQGTRHVAFAQALSALHRAEKHGDRTRDPSPQLRGLLEKAEALGRTLVRE
jgi:hypothetical protein